MREIADAGVPGAYDGEQVLLAYGQQQARLSWHAAVNRWHSQDAVALKLRDLIPMRGASVLGWGYVAFPDLLELNHVAQAIYRAGEVLEPWGWSPIGIPDAGHAYDAGLVLQEFLAVTFWAWNAASDMKIGVVWYPMEPGDWISPEILPAEHVSAQRQASPGVRCYTVSEWADAVIPVPPTAALLAPHFYNYPSTTVDEGSWLERALVKWRWASA